MTRAQALQRRALNVRVSISWTFTEADLKAIAAETGRDEPGRADLRYWMARKIRSATDEAKRRMGDEERSEHRDATN